MYISATDRTMPDPRHLVEVAIRYADHGWPVLALHTPLDNGCSCRATDCGSPGKHPRTRHGLHDATVDRHEIRQWWSRWPDANVGIITGPAAGLLVVDVDLPEGPASIADLERRHGRLPPTCEQRTGSGGRQLLFAHPADAVGNRARILPGVDVRGDGGYIVVPPSRHASGDRYRWTARVPVAPAPDWLVAVLTRDRTMSTPARRSAPGTASDRSPAAAGQGASRYAAAAMQRELAELRRAVEGTRNDSLNRAAFNLGQLVGAGALAADEVAARLEEAARDIGLGETETRRTVASGLSAGVANPRRVEVSAPEPSPRRGSSSIAPVRQLVRRR